MIKDTILIVPGHLGKDSGAISGNQEERYINLQQSISVCIAAKAAGYNNIKLVVPNGEVSGYLIDVVNVKDDNFSIADRIKLANDMNAVMIEIHNNSASFAASGSEILCFSKYDKNENLTQGYELGQNILENFKKMGFRNRGVKPIFDRKINSFIGRKLPILMKIRKTSIIVEGGFMSNKEDLDKIDVDIDGINEQIGLAIFLGICTTK